ncbi:hypothetical protein [Xanthobacter aminoxidans]|uniref:Phage gp6-like head-tail connector protein n=1 Tax=Xanthobacter aminoxidans TaxID=186280 RepID=A0ABW6Z9Z6_9HYPH
MWFPDKVTVAPDTQAAFDAWAKRLRRQIGLSGIDLSRDDDLAAALSSALSFAERYCSIHILPRTVEVQCTSFQDMERVPVAPVRSVVGIGYVTAEGLANTLPTGCYELHPDGLSASIGLAYCQQWPGVRRDSRITVTAATGFPDPASVPDDIVFALVLHAGAACALGGRDLIVRSETVDGVGSTTYGGIVEVTGAQGRAVEALLQNFRCWPLA